MPLTPGLRRVVLALGLMLAVTAVVAAAELTFDIPAARNFARAAVLGGRPDLARTVALGLLQADPGDADALRTLAAAEVQLGHPAEARRAAVQAFRAATGKPQRYEAARLAAKAAFDEGRLSLSQVWLRRAVQAAPDPDSYADTVAGYGQVQAQNRWRNTFRLSFTPSSNVNQGSSTDRLIIDGVPTIFTFSADAMALSGLQFGVEAGTSYRVAQSRRSQTEVGLRLVANQVMLSDAARRQAPAARGADYAYQAAEASLIHSFVLKDGGAPASVTLLAGRNFYGGEPLTNYGRVQVNAATPLAGPQSLRWQALVERQWPTGSGEGSTLQGLEARYDRALASGNRLGLRLGLVNQQSANPNSENLAVTAEVTFALGKPVGPAQVSLGLSATHRNFPVYFGNLFNDDGRQDVRIGVSIDLLFPKVQVWGFAPTVSLTGSRTTSNISRYEGQSLGLEVGLRSLF